MSDSVFNMQIEDISPKFILSWSMSMEPTTVLAIHLAKALGGSCKSIAVFDNWDNLSSKVALLYSPQHIVCFGQQSKDLAVRIHNIEPERIHCLGSSRFDTHNSISMLVKEQRNYVLIAGSSIALEDSIILDGLNKFLKRRREELPFQNFDFYYRPHPQPQGASIDLQNWSFDQIQREGATKIASENSQVWQSQTELSEFLCRCKVVIAAPTTLLLEALMCGSFVFIPAFEVRGIKTNIRRMLSKLEHLKQFNQIVGLSIARTPEELYELLEKLLDSRELFPSNNSLDYFVRTGKDTFASRLIALLQQVED